MNLLHNPGFESDWSDESSHRCLVIPVDGSPYETDVGNVFTPVGWTTWFRHDPGERDQPEVRDAWATHDPRRVHGGRKATLLFTFFRKHDAGFLQRVQVEPGTRLGLSAWAHAWSNTNFDHEDDPYWSEGAGRDVVAWPEGSQPHDTGDPQQDGKANFAFSVGVDPAGGTDPTADSVVWGQEWHIYNGFGCVTAEATAEAGTVTVFLRSRTLWPYKHNDAYWDDAELVAVEEPGGRGQPRVQYARTYVLVPPDAGAGTVKDVADAVWERERWTCGGSADDAGVGDLDVRRVIALDPGAWSGDLRAFYEEHYPGVEYWPLEYGNWFQLRGRLLACSLKEAGFSLAYPTTHRPHHVTDEFGTWRDTYFHNGLDLRSSWAAWGDEVLSATWGEVVVAGYNADEPWFGHQVRVRTEVGDGRTALVRYAHLVDGGIYVAVGDRVTAGQELGKPDNTGTSTGDHLHVDVKVGDEYADPELLIELPGEQPPPPPPPPPRPGGEILSVHVQGNSAAAADYIRKVKPAVVKLVMGMERAQWVKSVSPDTLVVYRQFIPHQGEFWEDPDPKRGARRYLETFLDSLFANAEHVDYVETLNEMIATGDVPGIKRTAAFDAAFCECLEEEGFPARPVVLTAGVGNPQHGDEVRLMLPAVRAVVAADGAIGYHAYFGCRRADGYCSITDAWEHFGGRALESWDPVFRAEGLYPKYLFGEGGAVYIKGGHMPSAAAGWRYSETLDGDAVEYRYWLMKMRRKFLDWNAAHGHRVIAVTLFTAGGGDKWRYFELTSDLLGPLAEEVTDARVKWRCAWVGLKRGTRRAAGSAARRLHRR